VCAYLNDILVFSKMEEDHFAHLSIVLNLLKRHHLKANLRKCNFLKKELKFLGHIATAGSMKPDPAKVAVECNGLASAPNGV
jgi:hypothetical protein